ncbi:hypothetical protein JZ785_24135 [Alicyclobacillus curvatus]|nr:hypothetical protein JZ785_24135 [Alicyclobacillus curvatus]
MEAIQRGQQAIGSFVLGHDPSIVRVAASAGLDFLLIDGEHGLFSDELISQFIDAGKGLDIAIMLRCTTERLGDLPALFDHGLDGVIVAGAQSAVDAQHIISQLKYPPLGHRGLNPFVPTAAYGSANRELFMQAQNDETTIWLLAESQRFLSEMTEVCTIPGLDGVFFGPYDLSVDLGVPAQIHHESVLRTISQARSVILRAGLSAGIFAHDEVSMSTWSTLNLNLLTLGFDWSTLHTTWSRWVRSYKGAVSSENKAGHPTPDSESGKQEG